MKKTFRCLALSALVLAALAPAAQAQSSLPINAAASVNGVIITSDAVEQGIKSAIAQGQKESPELRNQILSRLIEISLLAQQADKDGLANTDRANTQLAFIRQNYLADLEMSTFIAKNPVTDAEVKAEYDREVASLGPQGEIVEYKVSDIAVATEADALAALARIKKGESFDKVAKSVSLGANREQGGLVGWVQAGQALPQVTAVLVKLNKGQISPEPIQMPQGYFLVKLDDKRISKPPTLEQAKPAIQNRLIQKKQFEYLTKIKQDAKIIVQ
ncbi:peptidyl-prolyl cis-trans isomerase C [Polynucleobacter meluiroseus]|uniref:peptidylprolyl isomerase n=1 Tax=Polynucleobacter meluiroseus TaxID=1938814 RepID=A0A240E138_9BURK|nr:peptidylprolyl isomerase [Polynucleobacter meluiroseus]SNX29159.1 peptidyl-prolyl cis-trans isomerase C [Polynucleobacter meluiroseus]